jgi:hypothetical protein
MTLGQKLKLLVDWAPALQLLSAISTEKTPYGKAEAALDLISFAATKTATPMDDELAERVKAVLLSPAGAELFDYIVRLLNAVMDAEVDE